MKNTGIVRKIDELGRITLPIELRRTLGITEKDPLEIYVDDDAIILKPVKESEEKCVHCGSAKDLFKLNDAYICKTCALVMSDVIMEG